MRTIRGRLAVLALATLAVQIGSVSLTAVRLCCDSDADRAHDRALAQCPMHQPSDVGAAGHAHHDVGASAAAAMPTATPPIRITCDCGSDSALAAGPVGLASDPPVLTRSADAVVLITLDQPQLVGLAFSPPSPPPRTRLLL